MEMVVLYMSKQKDAHLHIVTKKDRQGVSGSCLVFGCFILSFHFLLQGRKVTLE